MLTQEQWYMKKEFPWSINHKALGNAKVRRAYEYAKQAHEAVGQKRKYTNEPYIVHPHEVASVVSAFEVPSEVIMAAYLHDVLEDTQKTVQDIEEHFGPYVCSLVQQLTDVSKPEDGNRAARKALDHAHSQKACAFAQLVKCADIYSNVKSIVHHDPQFGQTYVEEKLDQLRHLQKAYKPLWSFVYGYCEQSLDQIHQMIDQKELERKNKMKVKR